MRENLISIAVFHSNTYLAMIFAIVVGKAFRSVMSRKAPSP